MKRILTIGIAALALVFSSCKKDGTSTGPSIKATIDGAAWSANVRVATKYSDKFVINGSALSGSSLIVTVNGTSVGTYNLALTAFDCSAAYTKSVSEPIPYASITGTVTISKVDATNKKVSGTFEFSMLRNLSDNIQITKGSFTDIAYTEI